ncbi:MAG: hypothetical protein HUU16_00170 [Candidatus Omnitrophica bacterium]|nr:hypothetical protein [bacterium]NUN94564.1 hypothetical protein [Candidatus Omnitrophota bacterium]
MDQQMGTVSEILGANGKWGEVQITLAGKTYTWKECGRRAAREMLKKLIPILEDGMVAESDPARALRCIDTALDFFYEFHPRMRADKKELDDNATNSEVMTALVEVQRLLNGPFERDQVLARKKADMEPEHPANQSTKPESSNG